jgi:ribulose-phosphate 3-epimerase
MVKGLAKTVQVDICDGRFVSSQTWPYIGDSGQFEKIVHEDEGMPAWQELDYEFDLMVDRPEEVVEHWIAAGASRIVLHVESKGDVVKAIDMLKGRVEIGLAMNIDTPVDIIARNEFGLKDGIVQFVQLMGIGKVGFQGQEFDTRVVDKVREVKSLYPNISISVDGGVSLENAQELIEAGADRLVVGSAIFDSSDIDETIHQFDH